MTKRLQSNTFCPTCGVPATTANQQLSTEFGSSVSFINLVELRRNAQKQGCNFKLSRALLFKFSNLEMKRFDTHCNIVLHLFVWQSSGHHTHQNGLNSTDTCQLSRGGGLQAASPTAEHPFPWQLPNCNSATQNLFQEASSAPEKNCKYVALTMTFCFYYHSIVIFLCHAARFQHLFFFFFF